MLKNEELLRFFKTAYCFTDPQRNTAYENWISQNVKDKIVIDLGAGFAALGVAFFATAFAALGVALATAFAALGLALAGFASSILSTLSSNPIISHQLYIAPITR